MCTYSGKMMSHLPLIHTHTHTPGAPKHTISARVCRHFRHTNTHSLCTYSRKMRPRRHSKHAVCVHILSQNAVASAHSRHTHYVHLSAAILSTQVLSTYSRKMRPRLHLISTHSVHLNPTLNISSPRACQAEIV